jgi:hypothetical protein
MAKYQKEKITLKNKFGALRLNHSILLFLLLLGCQSREILPKGTGSEYFPLKKGGYWIYHVQETQISQVGGQTNTSYDLKVEITDSVLLSNLWTYLMVRSRRADASSPWETVETWSARKDNFQVVMQEGNTPFICLVFPFSEGKTWNGNALNSLGGTERCADGTFQCDNYAMSDLAKRFEGDNLFFDDTVTIFENNDNDPIVGPDIRKSVYAKSVGLIYKEISVLEYCTDPTRDCGGKQIVDNGHVLKQTMTEYGGL